MKKTKTPYFGRVQTAQDTTGEFLTGYFWTYQDAAKYCRRKYKNAVRVWIAGALILDNSLHIQA